MELAVLGPVGARHDGRELPLGGPKQRALLAMLLLRANEVVSRDRLIDGLWGERPPATAAHTLDNYISRLRKILGDGRLTKRSPGYILRVEPGELDLDRFDQLLERGRTELARGRAAEAAETLRAGLALWRGPALADVLYEPFAQQEAERLEDRRLGALEERVDADLKLGAGAELVPELEALVRDHPFHERLLAQLMLALYRGGRQAEALAAFERHRRRLAEELGLESGPELKELQRKILEHDPRLDAARARPRLPARQSLSVGRLAVVGAAAAAVVVSAAVGFVLGTGGTSASNAEAASTRVVELSAQSGAPLGGVPLDGAPATIVAGNGTLWIAQPSEEVVSRVDLAASTVGDRIPVGYGPGTLAVGAGSVWTSGVPGETVTRIDQATGKVTQTIPLGGRRAGALAFGGGRLWIAELTDNALIELDADSGHERRKLPLPFRPTALALDKGTMWVAGYDAGSIAEVDLRSGQTITTVHVGNGPAAISVGLGSVWVANAVDSTVARVDRARGTVLNVIPVGSGPTSIAISAGSVWVANRYSGTICRIDPNSRAVQNTRIGGDPTALAAADGVVWAGTRPRTQHRGGTLRLLHSRPISIDPAQQVDLLPLVSDGLTRDGLVAFNHVPGPAGTQLVPDLAISVPAPTNEGRAYTFRLRTGIRYSDGRLVRASDFRRAIERVLHLRSDGSALFASIVGAQACAVARERCDLSRGIAADDAAGTVTFHLQTSDPDFLRNLTEHGLATPVPPGTPSHDTGFEPIPGAGPYKIARATASEIRYVRNPFFREWSHAARPNGNPDEIVMRFGLTPEQEVRAISDGRADWMADNIPARLVPSLERRFAGRLHEWPSPPTTDFLQLNSTLPPFDDVRVRRALNLAIDRRAIVRIYGGRRVATPTCQALPPGLSGYRRYCPYTRHPLPAGTWTGPDLARARRLVEASGTRGTPITVWGWTDDPTISPQVVRYTVTVLRRLGYPARVRLASHSFLPVPLSEIQVIPGAWGDTTDAFLTTWFSCAGEGDHGWFCDRRVDRAILRARSLKATRPRDAASLWAGVDRELVDRAAWVPLINERGLDFVSARVRNYQAHPYWGIIADQLWLH